MTEIQYKPCSYCKQLFPATTEYFYKATNQSSGLSPRCKTCVSTTCGHNPRPKPLSCDTGFQQCTICKNVLPLTSEYFGLNGKRFRRQCRNCKNISQNNHRKEPGVSEKYNAKRREKLKDPIEAEKIRRDQRERRTKNPEYFREVDAKRRALGTEGREKHKERSRKYYWDNHEKIRAEYKSKSHAEHESKRRAKIHGLPYDWDKSDWQRCLEYWGNKCAICGRVISETHFLARDHWIAIKDKCVDNPGTVPQNILPLCHSYRGRGGEPGCNNSKWKHDPIAWLNSRYSPSEAESILARINEYFALVKR